MKMYLLMIISIRGELGKGREHPPTKGKIQWGRNRVLEFSNDRRWGKGKEIRTLLPEKPIQAEEVKPGGDSITKRRDISIPIFRKMENRKGMRRRSPSGPSAQHEEWENKGR